MKRAIAFVDLLAFSSYVRENTLEALSLFENYNNILKVKIIDDKVNPVNSYKGSLKKIAESKSINSFEYFIPFSDSIFISSKNPNKFIEQFSSYLIDCFQYTSNRYVNPENKSRPTEVKVKIPKIEKNGKLAIEEESQNWFPVLFRGGISFGEVYPTQIISIFESEPNIIKNLVGKPVVNAVKLEQKVKGPLIICDCNLYNKLNDDMKYFMIKLENTNLYMLLWPAFNYIATNGKSEISKFDDFFKSAVNLWKANNHKIFSIHYFNFIQLVVESSLKFFEKIDQLDYAKKYISKKIKCEGMEDKQNDLYGSYSL